MIKWGYTELNNAFSNWSQQGVQEELCNLITLKKIGYERNYENVLPMDAIDLVCNHYIVWIDDGLERKNVASFRSVNMETIERFKLENPSMTLLRSIAISSDISLHLDYLKKLMQQNTTAKASIVFFNGWTIHPDYRQGHSSASFIKRASLAPLFFSLQHLRNPRAIASGMPHLKSDQVLASVGFKSWLDSQGKEIPPIESPAFGGKHTLFMDCCDYKPEFIEEISFLKETWDSRLVLGEEEIRKAA